MGDLGWGWGFVLVKDIFDKGVMKESFKVVLYSGLPVSRLDPFYTSENVIEGLSG